ncbi:MAG: glycosyltransferase family 1 protein [Lachnospiraceae bacterium]|nr:glycosyltransferase family 1 protein [Lachnospiraceae bacterium]
MSGKEIKRIVMFKGDIETTAYFSMEMEKLFVRKGYQTFFYDYENVGKSSRELLLFLRKGETAVVTFNYHGLCGDSEVIYDSEKKEYIWDTFDVPCINIAVDHPFYYHRFFEKLPKRYIHISIDRNHERYMEEYFPDIERGPFLPLAGTSLYPEKDYKPIRKRSMDIVFTGNYVPPKNFNVYIERAGDEYTAFYMGILDELRMYPDRLLEDVAKKHILTEIPDATHEDMKETLGNMIFLDMYIRFWFRGEVVRILAESGYKIHVFGHGWEELECSRMDNLIIGGSLNSHECLEKISDAKISLNVMPWFKEGAHDRIFNSMLNGAVCLTDSSNYMDDYLVSDENAMVYSLEQLEVLPDMVKYLLEDEEHMQKMADQGFEMAKQDHIWEKRAIKIVDFLHTMN